MAKAPPNWLPWARPLKVEGRVLHQVAVPWHFGFSGLVTGDSTNDLISIAGDPNVSIHEARGLTCDVRAGRRRGPTTARLAGVRSPHRVAPNEDDPPAEQPDQARLP